MQLSPSEGDLEAGQRGLGDGGAWGVGWPAELKVTAGGQRWNPRGGRSPPCGPTPATAEGQGVSDAHGAAGSEWCPSGEGGLSCDSGGLHMHPAGLLQGVWLYSACIFRVSWCVCQVPLCRGPLGRVQVFSPLLGAAVDILLH